MTKLSRTARKLGVELALRGEPWYFIAKELRCSIADLEPIAKELGRGDPVKADAEWREAGRRRGEKWGADAQSAAPDEPIELFAALAHTQWSGWMRYLFSKAEQRSDGSVIIPADLVTRWRRQMETHYLGLPQEERESDRAEARRVLELLQEIERRGAVERLEKAGF